MPPKKQAPKTKTKPTQIQEPKKKGKISKAISMIKTSKEDKERRKDLEKLPKAKTMIKQAYQTKIELPKSKPWHKKDEVINVSLGKKGEKVFRVVGDDYDFKKEGFTGYKNWSGSNDKDKLNSVYGKDSVWAAKSQSAAQNFFYEKLKPNTTNVKNQKIYAIDIEGYPYVDIKKQSSEALARTIDSKSKKHHDAIINWVDVYKEKVVPHNQEVVLKGKIEPSRVTPLQTLILKGKQLEEVKNRPQVKKIQADLAVMREAKQKVAKAL